MNNRMLGTVGQPFCGKCCGEHTKAGSTRQKRQARRQEAREVRRIIRDELDGSTRSAVRLLTGLTDEELDDLGGFDA